MTITEFLLARIAEDEKVAPAAIGLHWHAQGGPELRTDPSGSAGSVEPYWFQIAEGGHDDGPSGYREDGYWERMRSFWHIGRHDPARVLAECKAKRAIVAEWDKVCESANRANATGDTDEAWTFEQRAEGFWVTLLALASVYADHPDYDPAWA